MGDILDRPVVRLPDGVPEEGDVVEIRYRSKRSENVLDRTGEVVSAERTDTGRLNFKVKEPGREGRLWGYIDPVGGSIYPDDQPELKGRLSRKTPQSKPHYQTHYGHIVAIERMEGEDGE